MPRGRLGKLGRTSAVKVVTFRLSQAERERLEADAGAAGVRPNQLARDRALGYAPSMSTESPGDDRNMSTESKRAELRVEYDE
jgi:hypothetical protein